MCTPQNAHLGGCINNISNKNFKFPLKMPIQVYTIFFLKAFKRTPQFRAEVQLTNHTKQIKASKMPVWGQGGRLQQGAQSWGIFFSVLGISRPIAQSCTRSWDWFILSSFPRLSLTERRGRHILWRHECGLCVHLCAQMHTFRCVHAEVRGEHQESPSITLHLIPLR